MRTPPRGTCSIAATAAQLSAAVFLVGLSQVPPAAASGQDDIPALKARVAELQQQLDAANARLAAAEAAAESAPLDARAAAEPDATKIRIGPVTLSGAIRANYVYGDYDASGKGPQRGGNGGDFELDTYRINAALEAGQVIGKLEYRWYNGYNFLHTGWLGYRFDDDSEVQAGVTRVPFGPGPYGVSQSWFFDQHYYVGLSDDMDFGVKYERQVDNWQLAFAWFLSSEGDWRGDSDDSARYSYDAVKWRSTIDAKGDVIDAPVNGFEERNQANLRAIYQFDSKRVATAAGISLQYGELDGKRTDDGHQWAASAHMVNEFNGFTLASQVTRYEYDLDDDFLGSGELVPLGAYDFAWPVAARAWLPAVSLAYKYSTDDLPWLAYVMPYVEYSSILKDDLHNDSAMLTLGSAWASGGWYIYTDYVRSNGNLFIGNEGDNYGNIYNGVGDFGVAGNNRWNNRFNINFGYYF